MPSTANPVAIRMAPDATHVKRATGPGSRSIFVLFIFLFQLLVERGSNPRVNYFRLLKSVKISRTAPQTSTTDSRIAITVSLALLLTGVVHDVSFFRDAFFE